MSYSYLAQCYMESNELSGHSRNCAYGAGADCTCGKIPPCAYGDGWCNNEECEECVLEKLQASWCPRTPQDHENWLWWEEYEKRRREARVPSWVEGLTDDDIPF